MTKNHFSISCDNCGNCDLSFDKKSISCLMTWFIFIFYTGFLKSTSSLCLNLIFIFQLVVLLRDYVCFCISLSPRSVFRQSFFCALYFTTFITTHIYGASHERASLQRLPHDAVEIFRRLRQLEELSYSSCEILHGFQSVTPFQCLIRPVQPEREVNHSSQCADMYVL